MEKSTVWCREGLCSPFTLSPKNPSTKRFGVRGSNEFHIIQSELYIRRFQINKLWFWITTRLVIFVHYTVSVERRYGIMNMTFRGFLWFQWVSYTNKTNIKYKGGKVRVYERYFSLKQKVSLSVVLLRKISLLKVLSQGHSISRRVFTVYCLRNNCKKWFFIQKSVVNKKDFRLRHSKTVNGIKYNK